MSAPTGLTVVVPSRGLLGLLQVCVRLADDALARSGLDRGACRLVVADNASADPYLPENFDVPVRLVRLDAHTGFARACNLAVARYPNAAYVLLNNDVLLHPDALRAMWSTLADVPSVGIVGTRLVYPDGSIQHAGVSFGGHADGGGTHPDARTPSSRAPREQRFCQAVTGACMMFRHAVFAQVGGLPEEYGFGSEDVEFCLKAQQAGWRIACRQDVDSLHFESMTEGRIELDIPARRQFTEKWKTRVTHDVRRKRP
jgi:GT2 family glycosyltransferase